MSFRSQGCLSPLSFYKPCNNWFHTFTGNLGNWIWLSYPVKRSKTPEVADFSLHFQKQAATHFTYLSKYWWNQALPALILGQIYNSESLPTLQPCRSLLPLVCHVVVDDEAEVKLHTSKLKPCYLATILPWAYMDGYCAMQHHFFDTPQKSGAKDDWLSPESLMSH